MLTDIDAKARRAWNRGSQVLCVWSINGQGRMVGSGKRTKAKDLNNAQRNEKDFLADSLRIIQSQGPTSTWKAGHGLVPAKVVPQHQQRTSLDTHDSPDQILVQTHAQHLKKNTRRNTFIVNRQKRVPYLVIPHLEELLVENLLPDHADSPLVLRRGGGVTLDRHELADGGIRRGDEEVVVHA